MAPANGQRDTTGSRPVSALPSVQARVLAFGAILVAGICGGLIGFSAVRVGCHGSCSTPEGVGGISGALFAAIGVSVIAVLVLRAMGEWRTIKEKRDLEMMIAAASAFSDAEAAQQVVTGEPVAVAALPEDVLPEDALPEDAVPKDAVPEDVLPEDAVPKDAVPKDELPEDAVRHESVVPAEPPPAVAKPPPAVAMAEPPPVPPELPPPG